MKEQLVIFETAKLAKEKGFNIKCELFYNGKDRPAMAYNISAEESLGSNPQYNRYILAPSQSLLQKWLWETHKLWVSATPIFNSNELMGISVVINSWVLLTYMEIDYNGYEPYEGLERGLYEALKLIK